MNREALRVIREEHATLAAMLQSLMQLVRRGPEVNGLDDSSRFFDVLRAMRARRNGAAVDSPRLSEPCPDNRRPEPPRRGGGRRKR